MDHNGAHHGRLMVRFRLNGTEVEHGGDVSLLHALRGDFALNGPRFGCGAERCGACHVLLDGRSVPSCALPIEAVAGREVVTLEGLGTRHAPHALQRAILAEQAGQCGWCLAGIVVSAAALLREVPHPGEEEVRAALEPHLCRCGSHNRIIRAVLRAAAEA
jgi:nicotinate dehydrogenase subunit A